MERADGVVRDHLKENLGVSIHGWQQDSAEKGWEETEPVNLLTRMNMDFLFPPSIPLYPSLSSNPC